MENNVSTQSPIAAIAKSRDMLVLALLLAADAVLCALTLIYMNGALVLVFGVLSLIISLLIAAGALITRFGSVRQGIDFMYKVEKARYILFLIGSFAVFIIGLVYILKLVKADAGSLTLYTFIGYVLLEAYVIIRQLFHKNSQRALKSALDTINKVEGRPYFDMKMLKRQSLIMCTLSALMAIAMLVGFFYLPEAVHTNIDKIIELIEVDWAANIKDLLLGNNIVILISMFVTPCAYFMVSFIVKKLRII